MVSAIDTVLRASSSMLAEVAVAAVVSGAGPTVLAFTDGDGSAHTGGLVARCPDGWAARHLAVSLDGARVE